MNILSTIFLLFISINLAYAEEGIIKKLLEYDVEAIIFEDTNARYINSEDWAQDAVLAVPETEAGTPPEKLDNLSVSDTKTTPFKNIKPAILNREYKRINNSKEYNVLFYGSWRQTGLEEKKAFKINIEELENFHKTSSQNTLTGNFKLILARYLHIYGELNYQRNITDEVSEKTVTANEPAEPTNEMASHQNEIYPMNIHRRMRSKELHYIDHPLVGMLIQINPVKVRTEKTAKKPATL